MHQESKRTAIYIGLAAAGLVVALWANAATKPAELKEFAKVGQEFYPDFDDPTGAVSLNLYTYDEEKVELPEFSVVFKDGAYRLPMYNDYPADARKQLARTAASLIGLKRDALAGRRESEHEKFGVISPRGSEGASLSGLGSRITLKNEAGDVLVDYIIGKQVEGETNQYYVRLPDEKETYKVRLSIDLSTRFSDWVDQDLLKVSQSDLRTIELDRYTFNLQTGKPNPGPITRLIRTDASSDWQLVGFESEEQQLSQSKASSLTGTLANLELLGVRKKPQGINADAAIDNTIVKNNPIIYQALAQDLARSGFYVAPDDQGEFHLYAEEGEAKLTTANGLTYKLRFGDVFTGSLDEIEAGFLSDETETEAEDGQESDDEENADESAADTNPPKNGDDLKQGRYLFISVNFDEALLGEPPVKPTVPTKPSEEEQPEGEKSEQESDSEPAEGQEPDRSKPALAERPDESAASEDENTPDGEEGDDEEADEPDPQAEYAAALAQYQADLEAYEEELKAYNERKEEGRKIAKESDERFAEWYYVISEESFKELRIPEEDLLEPIGSEQDNAPASPSSPPGLPPGFNVPGLNLPQGN